MNILIRNQVFLRTNDIKASRPSMWFLHGFADSGLAYKEVFESSLSKSLNIYLVDLPGFGGSPIHPNYTSIKSQSELITDIIKEETHDEAPVYIVAHSLGALIGTWVCQNLGDRIHYFFNIEGNLTEADSYFSSKPLAFSTAHEFARSFYGEIFEKAQKEDRYKRYYCSLRMADPAGMRNWSLTSQEYIKKNRSGLEFLTLACRKLYIWGDVDTSLETQAFIRNQGIPHKLYSGVGHWHMIENTEKLYGEMAKRIALK